MTVVLEDGTDISQFVTARNLARQYDFLETSYHVWKSGNGFTVDHRFVCELNFYAVQYLTNNPGNYRECEVVIQNAEHRPPAAKHVSSLMDSFINQVNAMRGNGAIILTAYALWRLNWIHPFGQGNGRTARALSYFLLCQELDMWLPGNPVIPEQIRASRPRYYMALQHSDRHCRPDGTTDLSLLVTYLGELLAVQLGN